MLTRHTAVIGGAPGENYRQLINLESLAFESAPQGADLLTQGLAGFLARSNQPGANLMIRAQRQGHPDFPQILRLQLQA